MKSMNVLKLLERKPRLREHSSSSGKCEEAGAYGTTEGSALCIRSEFRALVDEQRALVSFRSGLDSNVASRHTTDFNQRREPTLSVQNYMLRISRSCRSMLISSDDLLRTKARGRNR